MGPVAHGWNLNNRYMIYREMDEDEFNIKTEVHIIDLRKNIHYTIKNLPNIERDDPTHYFIKEFFQMDRTTFFMSNGYEIKILNLEKFGLNKDVTSEEKSKENVSIDKFRQEIEIDYSTEEIPEYNFTLDG